MSSTVAFHSGLSDPGTARHALRSGWQQAGTQALVKAEEKDARSYYQGGLPTPPITKDMCTVSIPNGNGALQQQRSYLNGRRTPTSNTFETRPPPYPTTKRSSYAEQERGFQEATQDHAYTNGRSQEEQIASHLQIPASVNNSKGSLPELAAELTCLFWFETSDTIEYAESLSPTSLLDRILNPDAIPSIGFRKWVATILSTTQVGKNVVMLALMFIYRLKKFNPSVSGKRGSEFRLLTIALMLGNKFLDDNTYTNKTWAEVSGISVNEIHIMEVEFLSNMRYELYASEPQWQEWKVKMNKFAAFYDKASRYDAMKAVPPTTPITQAIPYKLPSPPSGHRFTNGGYTNLPNPLHTLPHLPRSPAKHLSPAEYPFERKRSLDTSLDLPPAKRIHSSMLSDSSRSPVVLTPTATMTPNSMNSTMPFEPTRLPQLPIPTLPNPTGNGRAQSNPTPLALPASRAMGTVYSGTTSYSQSGTPAVAGSTTSMFGHLAPIGLASSTSHTPSLPGSAQTSPTNMYGVSTPTRPGLSPSYFLMNRSSPYRPVRHVNTLLYPPPSAALQSSVRNINYEQIHYQPLSKNQDQSQVRPGPMPCLHPDAWQSQVSTPAAQAYRAY